MPIVSQPPEAPHDLKKDCLSYSGVIAQSISVIAPSTVPAAVLGLIFVSARNGIWLSFLFGTMGLLFVCFNINQFAPGKKGAAQGGDSIDPFGHWFCCRPAERYEAEVPNAAAEVLALGAC